MGHAVMPGVEGVYIEASYRGHRAIPGIYSLKLTVDGKVHETKTEIKSVPSFDLTPEQYQTYDRFMTENRSRTDGHAQAGQRLVQGPGTTQRHPERLKRRKPESRRRKAAKELDAWDKEMVQRKSKAYDDVEISRTSLRRNTCS